MPWRCCFGEVMDVMASRSIKASQSLGSKELSPSWLLTDKHDKLYCEKIHAILMIMSSFSVLFSSLKHVLQEKVWIKDLQIDRHKRVWQPAKWTGRSMKFETVNRVLRQSGTAIFLIHPFVKLIIYDTVWCTLHMTTHDVKMAEDNLFDSSRPWNLHSKNL